MTSWVEIKRVRLTERHLRPGRTKHYLCDSTGKKEFPPFTSLVIAQYPDDAGFYLLHYCEGGPATDTYHSTLEDALFQAAYEFDVEPGEWIDIDRTASGSEN